jgi:5-methylcytosine-specific restriction endonuclease McrA
VEPRCAECRYLTPGRNIGISRGDRLAIYARDGWVCQICLEAVDPEVPANTIWGATLDHIVPRSKGGDDGTANLRLAHRWCNSARNDLSYYTDEDFRVA